MVVNLNRKIEKASSANTAETHFQCSEPGGEMSRAVNEIEIFRVVAE